MEPDGSVLPVISVGHGYIFEWYGFVVTIFWSEDYLVKSVVNLFGANDLGASWAVADNEVNKFSYRFFAHGEDGILHHEVDQGQELLELTKLISLF